MSKAKVVVKIDGDSKGLSDEFNKVKKSTENLEKGLSSIAKKSAVAFAGLTAAVVGSVAAFRVQEQAEIRTRQTIKATGQAAGLTAEEIFKMATELQRVTTFGDEAIISGQNLLLTFRNIGKDTFPRATKAMLDMSTAMGTGLKESAIQLGKALNDPTKGISALTRVGITFTEEQKNMIRALQETGNVAGAQAVILQELEMQFGGVSEAAAQGTGRFIQIKNAMGDFFELVGKNVVEILEPLTLKLKELSDALGINETLAKTTAQIILYGGAIVGITGVTAAFILIVVKLRNAVLLLKLGFIALSVQARIAWASVTLGLSLAVVGFIALVEKMGGVQEAIDAINASFQIFGNIVGNIIRTQIIGINQIILAWKNVKLAVLQAIPGNSVNAAIQATKMEIAALNFESSLLAQQNRDTAKTFTQIFDEIKAERLAEKVREEGVAAQAERDANFEKDMAKREEQEALRIEQEAAWKELEIERNAEAFALDQEIRANELLLVQAQKDQATEVEKIKLKQKIAALKKLRDKGLSVEQKAIFKNQDEIRKATEKDAKKQKEFQQKFQQDSLNSFIKLGKSRVKEGSIAQKALLLLEKASALKSIIINTGRAIVQALASTGPPLNFVLAGITAAAGAVQAAAVVGAQDGALVGAGVQSPPGDRFPFMLEKGELVVPRRNFDEVVGAVSNDRNGGGGGGGNTIIEIEFVGDAAEILTARQFENSTLGTDRE